MHRAWIALAGLVIAMPVRASDVIGTYDTPGEARHVALVGSLAYVADGTAGLRVLDVSVPAVPVEIGALATSPTAGPRDVVVVGSHAYVALGLGGVGVADVSIPAAPTWIAMLPLPGTVTVDVEMSGTLAFVAGGLGGLRIVDFAIPTAPVQVGSVSVGNDVSDVELSGSVAWIAAANGVYGYDVSVPSAPAFLSQPSTLASSAIEVIGDRLYTNSAEVFDISDPSAPVSISGGFSSFGDIELDGDLLVGQSSGFWVLDASDPDAPFRYGDLTHCGRAGIEVVGRYAYCIAESSGFNIYDVADPMHPLLVGSVPGIQAWALDVLGRYAYVGGSANGPLRIIDVANPAVPTIVATVPVSAFSVEVWGGIAYLGDGGDGLRVYDVRNPLAPSQIGFVPIVGPSDLELVGDRLYMAGGFDGFLIFDVSVPSTPALLGFFAPSPSGFADLVEVQNDVAYLVVTSPDRLIVLDVANPASPVQLASIPLADVDGIQIVGDLLYVTHQIQSAPALTVIDVADPSNPVVIGTLPSTSAAGAYDEIRIVGAVGLPSDGIALDLSDPAHPRTVGFEPAITGTGIETDANGLVFLSDGTRGIRIVAPSVVPLPRPECSNGMDDDGDAQVDYPIDVSCLSALDPTERSDCSDGIDNDGDGFLDYPADPSCIDAIATNETRPCSDGIDNDGDGLYDAADPQCGNGSNPETKCGLGAELAAAVALLRARRRRIASR